MIGAPKAATALAHAMPRAPDPALLRRILATRPLANAHAGTGALRALVEKLEHFLEGLFGSQAAFSAASWTRVVFFVAAGVLAAYLLARMLRRLRPTTRRRRAPGAGDAPVRLDAPADHLAAAAAARAAGALREAMRQELLAALSALETAELISYGRHRTNREYARGLAGTAAATDFAALVDAYDRRFYGLLPVDEAGLDAVAAAAARVLGAAAGRRAA